MTTIGASAQAGTSGPMSPHADGPNALIAAPGDDATFPERGRIPADLQVPLLCHVH